MARSVVAILINTVRTQALVSQTYFSAKREGVDEFTLARVQKEAERASVEALDVAANAERIEAAALKAVETQLATLRLSPAALNDPHPDPPPRVA